MNNIIVLYCKKILSRLSDVLSIQEQTAGGVLNIQSDIDTVVDNTSLLKNGLIKGIQRGITKFSSSVGATETETLTVNISAINPDKAIILYTTSTADARPASGVGVNKVTLTGTKITFNIRGSDSNWSTPLVIWQIIEFY